MKYITYVFTIFIILLSQYSYSQIDSIDGKKALTFTFNGLYLGGGVGGKYWLSTKNALRLQFVGEYRKFTNNSYSNNKITLLLGFEKHFAVSNELSPYAGTSIGIVRSESQSHATEMDLNGFIGIELWAYKNVSLSGEQYITFSYFKHSASSSSNYLTVATSTSALLLSIYF